jgi:hypothetical protein
VKKLTFHQVFILSQVKADMKALILDAEARKANVLEIPDARPAPNELLIKVVSIALNPIDPRAGS